MSQGIPSHGDRAAWDTITYATEHAKDIDDGTLRRHLATPGTAGDLIVDDATDWQRVSMSGAATLAANGMLSLVNKTKAVPLPIATCGGTATIEAFNGAPSINLDADGETFYASFEAPKEWEAASDLTIVLMIANEVAEDDGDDVSVDCQVHGYADGEVTSDAGQTVNCVLNLTGGDEAINIVNRVTGIIDYDHGTYPIVISDMIVIKATVNLAGGGECTGPLHILAWWIEYTSNKRGT